jgi:hypothetical protein
MTLPKDVDPILATILECLGKRKQNDADRDALDLELGGLFLQKRSEFPQDKEYGKWFRSAKLADHIKLAEHIKQREAHTLLCVAKVYPEGLPKNIPPTAAKNLAAPKHDAYRDEVLAALGREQKYRGKDVDKEIAEARSRAGLEDKPRKSAKSHKPQTPPHEDVQALVDMLIDRERSQPATLGDANAVIAWLRDVSGYGDAIKLDRSDDEAISTAKTSDDTGSNSPTETDIPKFPLHRGTDRQSSDHHKPICPRPIA